MTSSRDPGDEPDRSRLRWLIGALVVLAVPFVVIWWPGCREYPAVTSKESLSLMKLLYAACNTKDPVRLAKVEQGIEQLSRAGKMTTAEKDGFDKILGLAKGGDWAAAEKAAFKFAEDQIGVGHPSSHDQHKH